MLNPAVKLCQLRVIRVRLSSQQDVPIECVVRESRSYHLCESVNIFRFFGARWQYNISS